MTPEQLKVVRDHYAAQWRFGIVEVLDECIEIAEREAKLRADIDAIIVAIDDGSHSHKGQTVLALRAALETKGGET